jgi:flavodoxin
MKILVLFYSRTGTTRQVGLEIANQLKCDNEEIIDLKDRMGPINWLGAGRDAMKKRLTEIKEIPRDIGTYDLIIIGSPNWAGSICPAIRTFLEKNKSNIKKAAFFCTMGGDKPGNVFIQMEEYCSKPAAILSVQTKEVKDKSYINKLENFVNLIKSS